ncbi:GDP-Man:Man(3)GlcNAc(2)-PP-Dol alpha-1,2-mannosyltransferase-like [Paramacrobiotus metropolitanus]|uniref:GDP-Man:Man(3)GlcNAc(2)-PP-Dol alpha-1,2-mannosyltransferase-like n=1 Tax=Paramacrobiotus metropolitanus TaxID=2943436 RepID=UPI0024463516|nr:GDP-Man:Man(3)GlcNAc(2)-PP-Dol alpha-1,2-mannosyltransferase-like [Paramacrobiotus metropolitanus]
MASAFFALACVVVFVCITIVSLLTGFALVLSLKSRLQRRRRKAFSVGFFHPYCMGGGGGERVLWAALNSLGSRRSDVEYIIYTGDDADKCCKFREHVIHRFKISIPADITVRFVHLRMRTLLEAHHYPMLTMIGQSIGSMIVGVEALWKFSPDVYIDTTGHAFTFPLFYFLGGCSVGAYVHYPTISTDMLSRVKERKTSYNNVSFVSRNPFLSALKIYYYHIFAWLYGLAGRCCDIPLVNSTWTYNHIIQLWKGSQPVIVYPPCNVEEFLRISLQREDSKNAERILIVSIGQFRPEKDHALQLHSLAALLFILPKEVRDRIQMDFIGGCRNADDYKRVETLEQLAEKLLVKDFVKFHLNASFPELLEICRNGTIGIHTMWNEHFGIGVVEGMAAGLITVAHDSGGPKADIVVDFQGKNTGFLASDAESYAKCMKQIILLNENDRDGIRKRAKESVLRFTDEVFDAKFYNNVAHLL